MPRRARGGDPSSSTRFTAEMVDTMNFSDEDTLPDTSTPLTSFMGVPILGSPLRSSTPGRSTQAPEVVDSPLKDVIDLTGSSSSSVRFFLVSAPPYSPTPQSSSGSPMQGVLDLVQEDWTYKVDIYQFTPLVSRLILVHFSPKRMILPYQIPPQQTVRYQKSPRKTVPYQILPQQTVPRML